MNIQKFLKIIKINNQNIHLKRKKYTLLSQKYQIFYYKRKLFKKMILSSNKSKMKFWRKNEKNDEKRNKGKNDENEN